MKKSIKVLFTVGILGLVMLLGSCADLFDTVAQATSLYDSTFKATVASSGSNTTIEITFKSENINGNFQLDVKVGNTSQSNYRWNLDPEDLKGERDVIIYYNDTPQGHLAPNGVLPTTLTPRSTFNFAQASVTTNTTFQKQ
ncbi:MAG: hypothetical protein J5857_02320 [Treponema sp.]|nr:hypothetical protein [Treponema sp.]